MRRFLRRRAAVRTQTEHGIAAGFPAHFPRWSGPCAHPPARVRLVGAGVRVCDDCGSTFQPGQPLDPLPEA